MDIKEILNPKAKPEQYSDIIAALKLGRSQGTPNISITQKGLEPLLHDINDPAKRPDKKIKRPDAEENQATALQVSTDSSADRAKFEYVPVARVALALQKLIVNRAIAFLFGNDPTISADLREGTQDEAVLQAVLKVLRQSKARTLNREVARSLLTTTEAAEYWWPMEQERETDAYGFKSSFKLKCAIFSPLNGDTLWPYFDTNGDMIAFSREYQTRTADNERLRHFDTFTAKTLYKWTVKEGEWVMDEGYPKANPIGKIPVVYCCQPKVEWADVQSLIDRLETLLSNFADTNDYHASPKIFTTGTIYGWAEKGESGAVIEGEDGATAQYLSWAQAPESVKLEIETLLRMIHTITQTPDVSFDSVKGLNLSGLALKLLFMDAHLKVQDKREIFDEHLQRRNSIIQAYLAQMNAKDKAFVESCQSLVAEPIIQPYMIEDENSKVATLMAATGQKSIAARKTAIQRLGWTDNPEAELDEIQNEENSASENNFMLG